MKKYLFSCYLLIIACAAFAQDSLYQPGPDSRRKAGVPAGTLTKYTFESKLYNNFRDYYIYVPSQYDSTKAAGLMIFQDGHAYVDEKGDYRVPVVFDNLIYKKEIPVMIGVFINPGHFSKDYPANLFSSSNRSDEYDELSDRYVNFLTEELIPFIKKRDNISIDPKLHAIAGLSSGGICAFTAAWQRPDYFKKVMTHYGSFTNIKGGHVYPDIVRKSAKKDIKIFIQDGMNDLDNIHGNWWLANLQLEAALKFRGYDINLKKAAADITEDMPAPSYPNL